VHKRSVCNARGLRRIAAADRRVTMSWKPTDADQLTRIVAEQLSSCSEEQRRLFENHRVKFHSVPIRRMDSLEQVFVVAEFGDRVLYYEDIEEGFELARLDAQGAVPFQGCSQYELRHVLAQLSS
jgi:hypothetical protein